MSVREKIKEVATKIWWIVLLRGILALVLGLYIVTSPHSTLAIISLLLGVYWFVQGVLSIIAMFFRDSETPRGLLLAEGIIGLLAGIFVLNHRLFLPATLGILFAAIALMIGIANLAQGFKGAGPRAIILGCINILFGIILFGNPLVAASLLPIIVGICAIIGGIAVIFLALRIRKAVK